MAYLITGATPESPELNFATQLILNMFIDFFRNLYDMIGFMVTDIYTGMVLIFQTEQVNQLALFSMTLGASLCALMVAKHIIGTYGIGTEGDPDQDPIEIIFRLSMALGVMGANTWLFNELINLSKAICDDMLVRMVRVNEASIQSAISGIFGAMGSSPFIVILMGITLVGTVIFFISAFIRGAEITLSRILLPIFAVDLIHSNCEKWKMFIFQYVVSFVSYILQMMCYEMFLIELCNCHPLNIYDWFRTLGWLFLTIKTPKWLEKYIYATGTGQTISKGAQGVVQVIQITAQTAMMR